jgi:hypothetical protein
MKSKIKILLTTLIFLSLLSCKLIYSISQNKAKKIVSTKIDSNKKIVVTYIKNECKNFNIFVYENELFIKS